MLKPLTTIKCVCGAEILILPDVERMGYAIDFHVRHRHMDSTMQERGRIRDDLTKQVLDAVGVGDCPWEVKRFDGF